MVSVELEWYDSRLAWAPFIGGCHRASFRASLDAELTEIWVPDVELVNILRGVHSFPEAHASVRVDGFVRWRRSGVIEASCDLTGVSSFPFDVVGCSLIFGNMRDPLFHRINLVAARRSVYYSTRVKDDKWNYQGEYM